MYVSFRWDTSSAFGSSSERGETRPWGDPVNVLNHKIPITKVVRSSAYYFMLNYDTRMIAPTAIYVTRGLTSSEELRL